MKKYIASNFLNDQGLQGCRPSPWPAGHCEGKCKLDSPTEWLSPYACLRRKETGVRAVQALTAVPFFGTLSAA